jgi:hypothetical protein
LWSITAPTQADIEGALIPEMMNVRTFLLSAFAAIGPICLFAQNGVAINNTGAPAHPSAMLDVSGASRGVLINRMTTEERDLIANPEPGLQIYNTTSKCFEYFEYGIWQSMHCAVCPLAQPAGNIAGSQSVCEGANSIVYSVPAIANATGYIWEYSGSGVLISGTTNSVTLDFADGATSGMLTVKGSNLCGQGQVSPDFEITVSSAPVAPIAGTHSPSATVITWNWSPVPGASGYRVNTSNDYSGATDLGTATNHTQSNLTCETTYSLFVWSYNECGQSEAANFSQTTASCEFVCGNIMTVAHSAGSVAPETKSVNYGTVLTSLTGTNKCWITQNLGADNLPASGTDASEASAGWYWQFNRLQGYKHDGVTRTPSTSWISSITELANWSSSNDPCRSLLGIGWRIPTLTEWNSADANAAWTNFNSAFSSILKIHAAGRLSHLDGGLNVRGSTGFYYSSTRDSNSNSGGWYLYITGSECYTTLTNKAAALSIRCLKD